MARTHRAAGKGGLAHRGNALGGAMARAALGLGLAALCAAPARALTRCHARQRRSDGVILVSATRVTGTLRWGLRLGQETSPVYNAAACTSASGRARRCELAPPGDPSRTALPAGCVLYLADDSGGRCSAAIPRCLPTPPDLPCPLFPADNVWRADISALPVHPLSDTWVDSIGRGAPLHPDFGSGLYAGGMIGIPFVTVPAIQPLVPVSFLYADESDPGPYPIPPLVTVEGGRRLGPGRGDRHVLIVEEATCRLYELFDARRRKGGALWKAGSGAVWDLNSNALRPAGWTSADAAGLPILPGLVRYEEILAGQITHAIRFTAPLTRRAYVWPARHHAGFSDDPALPPMGVRARLKASFDTSGFSPANRIILEALKRYGMILADNGAAWFISGTPDPRWDNDDLHLLTQLTGNDFEFVDTSSLMVDPDSGQAN